MCLVVGLLNESKKDSIIIQYGNHAVLSCFHFVGDLSVFIAISTAGLQSDSLSDLYVLRKLELKFDYHKHSQLFNDFFFYLQTKLV